MDKYELTTNKIRYSNKRLYQIRAIADFDDVKIGDLGGWIETTSHLAKDCWVYPNVKVMGKARIYGGVFHGGIFQGGIFRGGYYYGGVFRDGYYLDGKFYDGKFKGGSYCGGVFWGGTYYRGLFRYGIFQPKTLIRSSKDFYFIHGIGDDFDEITFAKNDDGEIQVSFECFVGTIDEFEDLIRRRIKGKKFIQEYLLAIRLAKLHIKNKLINGGL